jgi:predicted dienelactone hydrolase
MARSLHAAHRDFRPGFLAELRHRVSNFLRRAGLTPRSAQTHAHHGQAMSGTARHHRTFPSLPRDYIQRRRLRRRISNAILIPLLSGVAAYFITRQTDGSGYSLPKPPKQVAHSAALSPASLLAHDGKTQDEASILPDGRAEGSIGSSDASPAAANPAVANPMISGAYKLADGPHQVTEVADIVLHDGKRDKNLHVRVFYPNEPGPYPVIVFSHGAGGSQSCCEALTRHWATYGYVTLQPTHDDSTVQRRNAGEEDINFLVAVRDALKKPALWQSRPQDVSFVLDSLPVLQKRVPALAGKMDAAHIGVGGHSMGAFTADAIAGALVDLPGHPATNFADPRVKAVVLLSPQGPGEFGLTDHSWDHVTLPLLSMTGSLDLGADNHGPDWKKIPFQRSQPGAKYHVFIEGANHMSFITAKTLVPGRAGDGDSILGFTNAASLAFWDAYLKADAAAKNYLQSDALQELSHSVVKVSRR